MSVSILIDQRFCGPPNSGNGGYTAGLIAKHLNFPSEITLRSPPPLNRSMQLEQHDKKATLLDGTKLIAEAKVIDLALKVPEPISYDKAQSAKKITDAFDASSLSNCFVCGSKRQEGDGLRIRPGIIGQQKVAAPWIPLPNFGNQEGYIKSEFIWAVLDCPGAWAIQDETNYYLLGRMAAKELKPVKIGKKYIVLGWVIGQEGRKIWTGTAIYDESGNLHSKAKGTWIQIIND